MIGGNGMSKRRIAVEVYGVANLTQKVLRYWLYAGKMEQCGLRGIELSSVSQLCVL